MIQLNTIKPNPNNPRVIRDDKFLKLLNSIKEFPKMMNLRPMVVDADGVVIGGNMRLKALTEAGYTEIPKEWVKSAADLTPEEQKRFVIADNVSFGEHDWDILANEWDAAELTEWGLDVPVFKAEEEEETNGNSSATSLKIEITCSSESEQLDLYNDLTKRGHDCRILIS